ncbi:MAG: triose-phosphate isomerase [Holosporales bacterium]|jgi:triosephosphate isomerase|nr:triose-phosphate isomerase [Holosporales bacterium]
MNPKSVICNWKMSGTTELVDSFLTQCIEYPQLIIAMPTIFIAYTKNKLKSCKLAAQDCSIYSGFGAHTGEISSSMLRDNGVEYVILGHSERRLALNESVSVVFEKLSCTLQSGLTAILCVSENYKSLLDEETTKLLQSNVEKVIIAYEPVSAIGTGKIPSVEEIEDALREIKNKYHSVRTIYGGSVNSKNAESLLSIGCLDGLLIGGASLNPEEIKCILKIQSSNF